MANGAYGLRMERIAKVHNIPYQIISYPDDTAPKIEDIKQALEKDASMFDMCA